MVEAEKNKDLMEVEALNTRSGRRYEINYGKRIQASENPIIPESSLEKEAPSFKYDFIDHLSRVLAKISLLDLLRLD